jgi:hypothetical protein
VYLYDQNQNAREKTSIKNLKGLMMTKFLMSREDSYQMALYIIQLEGRKKKDMINRKIVKNILEIVGTSQYNLYTDADEKHYLNQVF